MRHRSDGRGAHKRRADQAAHKVTGAYQHDVQMETAALLQFAFFFGDDQPADNNSRYT